MNLKFVGQGYNQKFTTSVGEELIKAFSEPQYTCFKSLVAFASLSGISALTVHVLKSKIRDYCVVVGIDQKGTSKEALQEFLKWDCDVYVYYTKQSIIFHPKIYLFEGKRSARVIIGSNNYTQRGLSQNIEAAVIIDFDIKKDGRVFLDEIEKYFEPILGDQSDTNLKLLTPELIERLVASKKVPTEAQRRAIYSKDKNDDLEPDEEIDTLDDLFTSTPIQKLPKGFNPTRISSPGKKRVVPALKNKKPIKITPQQATSKKPLPKEFEEDDNVLVAEIGGGPRWKQANFPKAVFENFFGAEAGNNNYTITLKHVQADGDIGEEEERQAVSVASQNYRFELGAASGLDYPTGERPIGIFIRLGNKRFLYSLLMPDDANYDEVSNFLEEHSTGPAHHLKRINTVVSQLKVSCPSLPLWEI